MSLLINQLWSLKNECIAIKLLEKDVSVPVNIKKN